jgi:hypothetical protein
VLLASAIAVMLMGALYVAVDVQLRHVQISRDVVEQSSLTRVLVARISSDIRGTLAPQLPKSSSGGGTSGAGTTGTAASTASTASAASNKSATSSMSSSAASTSTAGGTTSSSSSTASGGVTNTVVVNYGVQGDNGQLTIYVSKGPREVYNFIGGAPDAVAPVVSDLRRITYWLAGDSGSPQGLARQEVTMVTSADYINNLPPDIAPDSTWKVIAEEVQSVYFRYWDGSNWQDTWDSTQPPADNSSTNPQGPPLAIEITLGLATPGSNDTQNLKSYRYVVALPTANGAPQTSTSGTGTTGTTGTSSTGQ